MAFGNLGMADFSLLDDPFNIAVNPKLNPPTWQSLAYYWKTQEVYGLYVPLTYTVWWLLACVARVPADQNGITLNPWVFHSANVLLHLCGALAVFALLGQLLRNRRAACIGALFYALHPIQVEAVAWAAGLKDVLSGMLVMVALWQYTVAAQSVTRRSAHYITATLVFILALLAKPSAMMTPVLAFAIDYWLIHRSVRDILRSLAPWCVLAIACAINARIAQPGTGVTPAPIWARPFVVGDSLAFYLFKLVWPIDLAMDYGRRPETIMGHSWFYVVWIVPVALGVWLIVNRRHRPELLVAGVVLVGAAAPTLGVVTFLYQYFTTTADHYVYVAMLGPALAVAWVVGRSTRPVIIAAAACILGLLGIRTIAQTKFWQNDFLLFGHTLEVNPDSFMAMNNLGQAYLARGDFDEAEQLFRRAIVVHPDYWAAEESLAGVLKAKGKLDEAIVHRKLAVASLLRRPPQLRGDLGAAAREIGKDLIQANRLREAREYLLLALQARHDDREAQDNLRLVEERMKQPTTGPATTQQ